MGMRVLILASSLVLFACDSPSPWMRAATAHKAEAGGHHFTVWRQDDRVEIIRHGMAARADQAGLRALMAQVARDTTGCRLRPASVSGDTGVLRAQLICDGPEDG